MLETLLAAWETTIIMKKHMFLFRQGNHIVDSKGNVYSAKNFLA